MRGALWLLTALAWTCASAATAQPPEPPRSPDAERPSEGGIDPARLRAAQQRLARTDPPIGRVVRTALEVSASDPERVDALASRARLSGLVPSLRAGVRRGQGQDLSQQVDADDSRRWSTDDDLSIYGTLTFDLGRLAFAREEVALAREERDRRAERRELIRTVVALYYERRRLLLERALLGRGDLEHVVRVEELTALLNAFTDGAFSLMMDPRR